MKVLSLLTFAFIVALASNSCKKSSAGSPKPTTSAWTLNSISYAGDSSYAITEAPGVDISYAASVADLGSFDASGADGIDLYFASTPTASGTYAVIGKDTALSSTQVFIAATTGYGRLQRAGGSYFSSTSVTRDTVSILVSGNTITASFANITVTENGTTEQVSGTIVAKAQ